MPYLKKLTLLKASLLLLLLNATGVAAQKQTQANVNISLQKIRLMKNDTNKVNAFVSFFHDDNTVRAVEKSPDKIIADCLSIKQLAEKLNQTKSVVMLDIDLCMMYGTLKSDYVSSLNYGQQAYDLAVRIGDKSNQAPALNKVGDDYQVLDDYSNELAYRIKALQLCGQFKVEDLTTQLIYVANTYSELKLL